MQNSDWTDAKILASLRAGGTTRRLAWEFIFKNWRNRYLQKIRNLGGSDDETDEALGQMCIGWERTVTRPDFELKIASLGWYFDKSLVNAWRRLRQQKPIFSELKIENTKIAEPPDGDKIALEILDEALKKSVGEDCRTILLLFAQGFSMEEIGQKMGIGAASAKNQKCRCLLRLKNYFDTNPDKKVVLKNMIYG